MVLNWLHDHETVISRQQINTTGRHKECQFIWSFSKWHSIESTLRAFLALIISREIIYRNNIHNYRKECYKNIFKDIKNIHDVTIVVTQHTSNQSSRRSCSSVYKLLSDPVEQLGKKKPAQRNRKACQTTTLQVTEVSLLLFLMG